MRIIDAIGQYDVLVDDNHGTVRLWTRLPADGRTRRAFARRFPSLAPHGGSDLVRLGGYASVEAALRDLADARVPGTVGERLMLTRVVVPGYPA